METNHEGNNEQLQLYVSIKRGHRLRHAFFTMIGRAHWMDINFNPGEDIRLARLIEQSAELLPELRTDSPDIVENGSLYGETITGRVRQWMGRLAYKGEIAPSASRPPSLQCPDKDLPAS